MGLDLVPDTKFKENFLTHRGAGEDDMQHLAEFGSFYIGIFKYKIIVHQANVPFMQREQDYDISFCDNISTWIKKPRLLDGGWFSIGTSSTGTDRSIGGPLTRGQVDLAYHAASIIESWARAYRRAGNC